jgi:hypothetical protein
MFLKIRPSLNLPAENESNLIGKRAPHKCPSQDQPAVAFLTLPVMTSFRLTTAAEPV